MDERPLKPPSGAAPSLVSMAIVVAFLYFAKPVLMPLALAGLFAFALSQAVGWLERRRLGRIPSVTIVVLVAFSITGAIGWLVGSQLVTVVNQLPDYRANIRQKLRTLSNPGDGTLGKVSKSLNELNEDISGTQLKTPPAAPESLRAPLGSKAAAKPPVPVEVVHSPSGSAALFGTPLFSILGLLTSFGLVIIFTVFILLQREDLRNRFIRLAAPKDLHAMTEALDDATGRVSRYLRMQALVNTVEGILIAAGLYLIGVPYALLWGSLMTVLRFVVYFGPLVAGIMPIAFTFAVYSGWKEALYTAALLVAVEIVVANFVEPWLYGTHTGVSSFAVLASAAFWALLWGPVGLVLATPLTACLVVLGRYLPHLEFISVLLGDAPVLAPDVRFYQRLLALDYDEARAIALDFLEQHSRLELYDELVLPALRLSEEDRHRGVQTQVQEEFVAESLRELIGETAERKPEENGTGASNAGDRSVRILCLAARDEADEISAMILAQLLEAEGFRAAVSRLPAAHDRITDLVKGQGKLLICVSALPPFSLLKARSISAQLRTDWPETEVLVGLWTGSNTSSRTLERVRTVFDSAIVTSLREALEYVSAASPAADSWQTPLLQESVRPAS